MTKVKGLLLWMGRSWKHIVAIVALSCVLFACRATGLFDFYGTVDDEQSQESPITINPEEGE